MFILQEIAAIQEIDNIHIDLLVLDHLQIHVINLKILLLDIVFVGENPFLIELHHAEHTLNLINNEATLDLPIILLSEKPFLDLILGIYRSSQSIVLHIDLFQNQFRIPHLHLEGFFINLQPNFSENLDLYSGNCHCTKTNLVLLRIPLKV